MLWYVVFCLLEGLDSSLIHSLCLLACLCACAAQLVVLFIHNHLNHLAHECTLSHETPEHSWKCCRIPWHSFSHHFACQRVFTFYEPTGSFRFQISAWKSHFGPHLLELSDSALHGSFMLSPECFLLKRISPPGHQVSPYHQVPQYRSWPGCVLRCGHLRPTWKANEKTQALGLGHERQPRLAIACQSWPFRFAQFARLDLQTGFQDPAVDSNRLWHEKSLKLINMIAIADLSWFEPWGPSCWYSFLAISFKSLDGRNLPCGTLCADPAERSGDWNMWETLATNSGNRQCSVDTCLRLAFDKNQN